MKIRNLVCCPILAAVFLLSCATPKKVLLDPITVKENAPGIDVYRGSYPKTTDIIHTKLDLSFNWDSAYVVGKAIIQAKPYFYPLSQAVLDANGFRINKVALSTTEGQEIKPLKFTYNGKKLSIDLDKVYTSGQKFNILIDYVAMPYKLKIGQDISSAGDRGLYFINRDGKDKNKPQQIWTQGETECNSTWFPTINGPQEKMTQEISLTVAEKYVTLSNGTLEYSSMNGDGTRTDTWRQEQPHSTYLTMLAVGNFTITKDKWEDKEVNYYTEPEFASTAKLVFGKTPEMISYFSKKMGVDYPWDKYSQIVVRDFVSGAMENTSATVFFDRMNMTEGQYLDENYEDIIAHELFHHWFGDLVTAESWANLPLNESFATYAEYLWIENKYGREAADLHGMNDLFAYLNGAKKKQVDVIRFDYADREQMFDEVTYQKGGRILHMLRKTVGDDAFFKALNLYLTRHKYKTAEIHDLRIAFEETAGQDLNWFFNQWFLASGHPVLTVQTTYSAEKKQSVINIRQDQDLSKTPLYRIPLAVDIYSGGKTERKQIVLDKQSQAFVFPSQNEPQLVNVDAENYLVGEKNEVKTLQQYVFQYQNAPLLLDRIAAVVNLGRLKDQKVARDVFISALKDKNWLIRQTALEFVGQLEDQEREMVYQQVKEMAVKDERSYVRAAAVQTLSKVYSGKNNTAVFEQTANDKAPSVIKATLEARK